MPRIASTIPPAPPSAPGRTGRGAGPGSRSKLVLRVAAQLVGRCRAAARRPRGRARAAAARRRARRRRCCPCRRPPTSRPGGRQLARRARPGPLPARSISSSPGIPRSLDRPFVERALLGGVGQRARASREAHGAVATATAAASRSGVGQRDRHLERRAPARARRRFRAGAARGGPPPPRTSTSRKLHAVQTERLGHRLLGAEARGQVLSGARA